MALTIAECDEMIAAAERNAVILQLGFMRRFDPDFQAAKARIEAGEIGQPMLIKSLTHGPDFPPAWARDLQTSNGMLAEVNSHDWTLHGGWRLQPERVVRRSHQTRLHSGRTNATAYRSYHAVASSARWNVR